MAFVNNDDYGGDSGLASCNCMDESCPNSGKTSIPYNRFSNDANMGGSGDVVGATINIR